MDEYSGWLTFDPKSSSLDHFLQTSAPSRTPATRCAWIAVRNPNATEMPGGDVHGVVAAFQQMPDAQKSQETLDILAHTYGVLCGKWMLFIKQENIDEVWAKIARAVVAGELGPSAKVSPYGAQQNGCHLICVYTDNFTDEMDVLRVRQKLYDLEFNGKLNYKPDLYTYCDIYSKNPWKIQASRYRM
jgi:hypothetical protein